jgi:hypothetical protein
MKIKIKLSRKHPNDAMAFGRFTVTPHDQEIELNDAEVKDLKSAGPKHWFTVSKAEAKKEEPKKETKKKVIKKGK